MSSEGSPATAVPSTWRRPETKSLAFRRAARLAHHHGFSLNVAKTKECAERQGRFWLTATATGCRVLQADTLARVEHFLEEYRPPARSWSAAVLRRLRNLVSTTLQTKDMP
ncbi:MAG: hypothetical protein JWP29_1219 [Rhodoferax sp.]|nr:hypothetical protein [Rhodoferax sp.]